MPQLLVTPYQSTGADLFNGIASAVLASRRLEEERKARAQSMAVELLRNAESARQSNAKQAFEERREDRMQKQFDFEKAVYKARKFA